MNQREERISEGEEREMLNNLSPMEEHLLNLEIFVLYMHYITFNHDDSDKLSY